MIDYDVLQKYVVIFLLVLIIIYIIIYIFRIDPKEKKKLLQLPARLLKRDCLYTKFDHFNTHDQKIWKMRYASINEFFRQNGPLFIFIGGENPFGYPQTGPIYHSAVKYGGCMFYIEHRFYGKITSSPGLSTESLKYVSTHQALADLAYFIESLKERTEFRNSKVVVVGSNSKNMATWSSQYFDHIIKAALSSSSPIEAIVDFDGYSEVNSDNIRFNYQGWHIAMVNSLISVENFKKLWFWLKSYETFIGIVQDAYFGQINYECGKLLNKPGNSFSDNVQFGFTEEVVRRGVEWTNIFNGVLNLDVNKVLSVHGTIDGTVHFAGLLHIFPH